MNYITKNVNYLSSVHFGHVDWFYCRRGKNRGNTWKNAINVHQIRHGNREVSVFKMRLSARAIHVFDINVLKCLTELMIG